MMPAGSRLATKRSRIEIRETTAIRINARLGGRRRPVDPADVTRPIENRSEYPARIIRGTSSPPSARISTPDDPVKLEKNAQTSTVPKATPPGIQPNSARNTSTSRSLAPVALITKPTSVKSGIAGMIGELAMRYASTATAAVGTPVAENRTSADPPMTT